MFSTLLTQFPAILQNFADTFSLKDVFDILIVTFLVYLLVLLLKRTHSYFVLGGMLLLFGVYAVAYEFNFYLTSLLLQYFFTFFIVILAVVFQRELRNFFEWIFVLGLFARQKSKSMSEITSSEIIETLEYLAQKKIGALIVLGGIQPLGRLLEGGFALGGHVSKPLLLSIFDPSSPGHDGAVVIEGDQVKKFGVHLPLAEKFQRYKELGTRHRSALGLSERSDALVLIVSEERGTISVAHHGELQPAETPESLRKEIKEFLSEGDAGPRPWHRWFTQNLREKTIALGTAVILWFVFVFQFGVVSRDVRLPVEFRFLPKAYIVDEIDPREITVTLSGRNQAFYLFDPKNSHATIDLSDVIEGYQRTKIEADNVSVPSSLTVTNIAPKTILYHIKQTQP